MRDSRQGLPPPGSAPSGYRGPRTVGLPSRRGERKLVPGPYPGGSKGAGPPPQGLYLLDEPEAALSPQSQLAFLSMVRDAVEDGGQFIIATHSPILMAIPEARIFSFDGGRVRTEKYEDLDSVMLVREFLQAPDRYLQYLSPPTES